MFRKQPDLYRIVRLIPSLFYFLLEYLIKWASSFGVNLLIFNFVQYHSGYTSQVRKWPVNPLDVIIEKIEANHKRDIIADFGCGEARLAQSVSNKVHSFDLVACNRHVTECDIANVPLKDNSVDVGVFCLSLMGTNYPEFLMEAQRVIRPGGKLYIAEVRSRFEPDSASSDINEEGTGVKRTDKDVGDTPQQKEGLKQFKTLMKKLGFQCESLDKSNKMFVLFEFCQRTEKDGTGGKAGTSASSKASTKEKKDSNSKTGAKKRKRASPESVPVPEKKKKSVDKDEIMKEAVPLRACKYKKR